MQGEIDVRKLQKPDLVFEDIFDDCTDNMQNPRKHNLQAAKQILIDLSIDYDDKAEVGELYIFQRHENVTANVAKKDMVYLYEGKLLNEGRAYYDQLLSSSPHNTCPFCSQRKVKSLDHFLPKTLYPAYAITPYNLVPCCSDCNKDKDTLDADTAGEELIHPYYDDLGDLIWLNAEVIERAPISFQFTVNDFSEEDEILHARISNQFKVLSLGKLYSSHASEELENIRYTLQMLSETGDAIALNKHLETHYNSCFDRNPNSWNSAMYRAVLNSDWFKEQNF